MLLPYLLVPVGPVVLPVVTRAYRPAPLPLRLAMLTGPSHAGLGLAAGTAGLGFGAGPGAIEPFLEWFSGGHTIGGPSGTSFRGVSASSFPLALAVLGSGAPLATEATGLAGTPIGGPP